MRRFLWAACQIAIVGWFIAFNGGQPPDEKVPLGAAVIAGATSALIFTLVVSWFLNLPGTIRRWQAKRRAARIHGRE